MRQVEVEMFRKALVGLSLGLACATMASAQEVTLKLHHFTPAMSNTQQKMLEPWARRVEEASNGRIAVRIYPSMQLGGNPAQLFDQVRDGVVDIAWVVPGYTRGRFLCVEIIEAPFVGRSAAATSRALWDYATENCLDQFEGVRPLAFHTLATASVHSRTPVHRLEDFRGLKVRAPTAMANQMVEAFGATAVAMPFTQVVEAVARGVVDAFTLPMESVPTLRLDEIVHHHTDVHPEGNALYTATLVLAMNPRAYDALPDDLKAVIDSASGPDVSRWMGQVWDDLAEQARDAVRSSGNEVHILSLEETMRWAQASASVRTQWVEEITREGRDGGALLARAEALIEHYTRNGN